MPQPGDFTGITSTGFDAAGVALPSGSDDAVLLVVGQEVGRVSAAGVKTGAFADLTAIGWTARGILSETMGISQNLSSAIPVVGATNGTLVTTMLPLTKGQVVTSVACFVTVAGVGLTFVKMGLYDKTGALLAATAEASASFNINPNTPHVLPLVAPVTIPSNDGYQIGFLQYGNGATGATILRGISATGSSTPLGAGMRPAGSLVTQTDIAGPVALGAGSQAFWFAAL